jgi:hypothetical protein
LDAVGLAVFLDLSAIPRSVASDLERADELVALMADDNGVLRDTECGQWDKLVESVVCSNLDGQFQWCQEEGHLEELSLEVAQQTMVMVRGCYRAFEVQVNGDGEAFKEDTKLCCVWRDV